MSSGEFGNFGGLESFDWNSAGDSERAEKIGCSGRRKVRERPPSFAVLHPQTGRRRETKALKKKPAGVAMIQKHNGNLPKS
jgi:hypothetical protein